MQHANKQRMAADGVDAQKESIKISKFWEEELKSMPYVSQVSHFSSGHSPSPSYLCRNPASSSISSSQAPNSNRPPVKEEKLRSWAPSASTRSRRSSPLMPSRRDRSWCPQSSIRDKSCKAAEGCQYEWQVIVFVLCRDMMSSTFDKIPL